MDEQGGLAPHFLAWGLAPHFSLENEGIIKKNLINAVAGFGPSGCGLARPPPPLQITFLHLCRSHFTISTRPGGDHTTYFFKNPGSAPDSNRASDPVRLERVDSIELKG